MKKILFAKNQFLRLVVLVFIVVFISSVTALEEKEIDDYFEAGDYPPLHVYYEKKMEAPLSQIQLAVLEYDQGTVFLAEGKWKEALENYQDIFLGKNPPPFLIQRLKYNTALALIKGSQGLLFHLRNPHQAAKISQMAQEAVLSLEESQEAFCQVNQLLRHPNCEDGQRFWTERYEQMKLQIEETKKSLARWKQEHPNSSADGMKSIDFFMNNLSSEMQELYLLVYPQIVLGLNFYRSIDLAKRLLHRLHPSTSDLTKLKSESLLISRYLDIVKQYNPQHLDIETIQNKLDVSTKAIEEALSLVNRQDIDSKIKVQLLIKESQQELMRSWWIVDKTLHPTSAKKILQQAIEELRYLIWISKRVPLLTNKGGFESLEEKTKRTLLQTAIGFYQAVIDEQKTEYARGCQREPWEGVVPLFDRGYELAYQGNYGESLKYWKQALKLLDESSPRNFSSSESSLGSSSFFDQEMDSSTEQLLTQIEEMEYLDSPYTLQPMDEKPIPKGLKPW
jgi:tetratricopeptide (TPR) repeat protein